MNNMKFNIKYVIAILMIFMLNSCDDKLESFEVSGSTEMPVAIDPSLVQFKALPGQILLSWTTPDKNFTYMKVWYNDPISKKDVYKIVSPGTLEILISNTRARFGEYTFHFQTFNAAHVGSEIKDVKAVSGVAPSTITIKSKMKIALTADMLSTNAQEPSEGPIKNLVDGDSGTFFHTRWSSPQIDLPHWIEIQLREPHENFIVYYMNRKDNTWTSDGRPRVVELQISNDGSSWETVETLSGLPATAGSEYTSNYVMPGKTFTYFRFKVTATTGNTKYFNLAEFALYDVVLDIYNPETEPLD